MLYSIRLLLYAVHTKHSLEIGHNNEAMDKQPKNEPNFIPFFSKNRHF